MRFYVQQLSLMSELIRDHHVVHVVGPMAKTYFRNHSSTSQLNQIAEEGEAFFNTLSDSRVKYSALERQYNQPVIVMAPRVVQAPINAKKARPGPRYRKNLTIYERNDEHGK